MPLTGSTVNYAQAKGIITPTSTTSPTPIGASNYTTDFFRFHTNGGAVSLIVNDGSEFLTAGTPDPGAMLRSTLTILNTSGSVIGTATEAASTLSETFSGTLAAGTYYAEIASYGGHTQTLGSYNTTYYFDMGSYFITGSGLSVPEPGTWAMLLSARMPRFFHLSPRLDESDRCRHLVVVQIRACLQLLPCPFLI